MLRPHGPGAAPLGLGPRLRRHDGDRLEAEPIALPKTPRALVVDLGCDKDTPLMLKSLQAVLSSL